MYCENYLLWFFIYSSAAVFIIVGGQSTTGDDNHDDPLANIVATLQKELAKLAAKNEKLEAEVAKLGGKTLDYRNFIMKFLLV